ncbi:hypothetical protein OC844_007832 [Tilletia horrida]|nr:hypothetical protein OC844_007832 [Tilletia horrida]
MHKASFSPGFLPTIRRGWYRPDSSTRTARVLRTQQASALGEDKQITTALIGKREGQEAVIKTPSSFRHVLATDTDHETTVTLVKYPVP